MNKEHYVQKAFSDMPVHVNVHPYYEHKGFKWLRCIQSGPCPLQDEHPSSFYKYSEPMKWKRITDTMILLIPEEAKAHL